MADSNDSLFFAESDEEEMNDANTTSHSQTIPEASVAETSSESCLPGPTATRKSTLFLPDSDDDDMDVEPQVDLLDLSQSLEAVTESLDDDVDIPQLEHGRASSVSTMSSSDHHLRNSSPVSSVDVEREIEPPKKKRKLSPEPSNTQPPFTTAYLGSFLVGNAWSTVRGRGYVKARTAMP